MIRLGCGMAVVFLAMAALGDVRAHVPTFLALYGVAFALYIAALRAIQRRDDAGGWRLGLCLALACVFRVILYPATPTLSDDVYRYRWDGRIQAEGINPYRYAPSDPALSAYRDAAYEGINHKDTRTIYPPLMEAVFHLTVRAFPGAGVRAMKVPFLMADLGCLVVLLVFLVRCGRSPWWSLAYAWNPLVVVETAGSGHGDALGAFLLLVAVYRVSVGREGGAVTATALSFLAKLGGAAFLPYLARRLRRKAWLLLFPLVVIGAYLPFVWGTGIIPHAGLGAFAHHWEFNGSLYKVLVGLGGVPEWVRRFLLAGWAAFLVWLALREDNPARYAFLAMGSLLLAMPVVHPWYLVWVAPFLCFFPYPGWVAFTGLAPLSYAVLIGYARGGAWREPPWVAWVEYLPVYGLLAWGWWKSRSSQ